MYEHTFLYLQTLDFLQFLKESIDSQFRKIRRVSSTLFNSENFLWEQLL